MGMGRMVLALFFILFLYGGLNFYIGKRIFQGFSFFFTINALLYSSVFIFISLSLILAYLPLPYSIKEVMAWIGSHWMGIFAYLLALFIVADLLILLGSLIKIIPNHMLSSIRFYESLAVILITIGIVIYGVHNAKQIKHISYDIQIKEDKLSADMKIVLISDLHLGATNSEKNLETMVRDINNLKADIVCIAGDIFNDDYNAIRKPDEAINLLKGIEATYGVYASLGNHDGGNTFDKMLSFLEQSNIKLLNDEYVIIDERLVLLGRVDSSPIGGFGELLRKDIKETIASLDENMPVVVMEHNPANIEEYGGEVDLILSGHTHKGQMFPGSLVTNAIFIVDYGHYQKDEDSPHIIVTSGVGTWGMPMRVGTNNEIVSILLQ